jgi:hypothetical protein
MILQFVFWGLGLCLEDNDILYRNLPFLVHVSKTALVCPVCPYVPYVSRARCLFTGRNLTRLETYSTDEVREPKSIHGTRPVSPALEHDARGGERRKWGRSGAVAARRCSLESLAGCAPQLQQNGKR